MRLPTILCVCASLGACGMQTANPVQGGATSAQKPAPQPTRSATAGTVTSLAGEWRVAGVDGADFNEPYGLALRGSAQELWWEPRCAWIVRSYRIDGGNIAFGPPQGAPKPGEVTPAVCTIAPPLRIAEVTRALDAATSVARTEANGILISGGGHSVLLFSQ